MSIVAIGLSHRTAPVTLRERFAFDPARIPGTLQQLRDSGIADEAVILSTCNRVEIYAATSLKPAQAFARIHEFLVNIHEFRDPLTDEIYKFAEPQSVEHLFKVASGLDSMVLGETEILGQLKTAYDLALQHKHTGGRLNKAFQKAFNVAKHIRTDTGIQRGSISVASVAVELAEKIFSTLADRTVLVIGAGDTSEKTARALVSRGAKSLLVTNRSFDKAAAIAAELGGRAVPFDAWAGEFANLDIIISSTTAPDFVLDRARLAPLLKLRHGQPLLLIDIAVPRDIEPEVNSLENVFLYNVDDLQAVAAEYLKQRQDEIAKCEQIIRDKVHALLSHSARAPISTMPEKPIIIATRGSALALAQANNVFAQCRAAFPRLKFELKIMKTTGDKLLTASLANPDAELPKGLFTKELEVALLKHRADLAVHSLKDLPTELPAGLTLGAVGKRADVRDVLIYRDAEAIANRKSQIANSMDWSPGQSALTGLKPKIGIKDLPKGAVVATSSTRRQAQLKELRPDLKFTELRGNIITRMEKLASKPEIDATILAAAGLGRLNFTVTPDGKLVGDAVPDGLNATVLDTDAMLPCVGQAAVGIEIRAADERIEAICARLNHAHTQQCVTAERAFLAAMGGGCASPVAAHAEIVGDQIRMRVVSFMGGDCQRTAGNRAIKEARELGEALAAELKQA